METTKTNISDLVTYLQTQGLSYEKQAPLFGVTPLQVRNYKTGFTKKPSVKVAWNVLTNVMQEGKPVLLEPFDTVEALEFAFQSWSKEA